MTATVKVVRFLAGDPSLAGELRHRWVEALASDAGARPARGRPVRVALAVPVALPELPPPRFAAVDLQWFAAVDEARANEAWLGAADAGLRPGSAPYGRGSCRVIAEEVVLRGRAHLDARWQEGGERYKMMSFGRRNPALTAAEFSARWRREAGNLGGEPIPDAVRGSAYVQNHPLPLDDGEWPLDAVNEVYVEDLDALRRRAAWFAARRESAGRSGAGGLMSPTEMWSMGVRESPLTPAGGAPVP